MMRRLEIEGLEEMCNLLRNLDPEHWEIVDRKNPRRVSMHLRYVSKRGRHTLPFVQTLQRNVHLILLRLD